MRAMITYAKKTDFPVEWRSTGFALPPIVGAGHSGFRNRCTVRREVGLVWVYRDIRIEDQAAIRAAENEDRLAVLFVQDPLLVCSPPADLLFLNDALEALREELVARGSNLFLRSGIAGEEVAQDHFSRAHAGLVFSIGLSLLTVLFWQFRLPSSRARLRRTRSMRQDHRNMVGNVITT